MTGNDLLGLIYSNTYDTSLSELTSMRSMGSVPFAGRYRLIDFPLSAMVECGMSKVGILTNSNYQSLMDHLGSGRAYDLSRKNGGLYIIPPFNTVSAGLLRTRIEALSGAGEFLKHCDEEYVVLSDCNVVYNFDLQDMFEQHKKTGADITIAYAHGKAPSLSDWLVFDIDSGNKIIKSEISPSKQDCDYSMNVYIMRKALLERIIKESISLNQYDFEKEIILDNFRNFKMFGYKANGFVKVLDNIQSYFDTSMSLLTKENRYNLFKTDNRPIHTKIRDDVPTIYGLGADCKNSLITDGCTINGTVENCILSRDVHIGKGSVVKNSILMNHTYIGDNVHLNCIIADKEVVIKSGKTLCGEPDYPVFISKGIVI